MRKSTIRGPKSTIGRPKKARNPNKHRGASSLKDLKEIKVRTSFASGFGVRKNIKQTQEGSFMKKTINYPKTRKPRETAYAKGTKLINKLGLDTVRSAWEKHGMYEAASMLSKASRLKITPGIMRNLAVKYDWKRKITDLNDPLFKMVLKNPERRHAFRHITFMIENVSFDTFIQRIENVLRMHPRLCYDGYHCHSGHYQANLPLRGFETQLSELPIALYYLKYCNPATTITKRTRISSYSLKHCMEHGPGVLRDYQGYIANSTAILAAILTGFPIKHICAGSKNVWIGIAPKSAARKNYANRC